MVIISTSLKNLFSICIIVVAIVCVLISVSTWSCMPCYTYGESDKTFFLPSSCGFLGSKSGIMLYGKNSITHWFIFLAPLVSQTECRSLKSIMKTSVSPSFLLGLHISQVYISYSFFCLMSYYSSLWSAFLNGGFIRIVYLALSSAYFLTFSLTSCPCS